MYRVIDELPWREPVEAFAPFADEPFALLLDWAQTGWSFIAVRPFSTLTMKGDELLRDGAATELRPFDALRAFYAGNCPAQDALFAEGVRLPFMGGVGGYLGYDLGASLERLPPPRPPFAVDDQHLPGLALGAYDFLLAFDAARRRVFVIARPGAEKKAMAAFAPSRAQLPPVSTSPVRPQTELSSNFSPAAYRDAVARVIDYIHAGDIFQANLSQRFEARLAPGDDAFMLYRRLTAQAPAPHAAFFNFGEGTLVSNSPERFLQCRDGLVETRPIKGTRPRGRDAAEDAALAAELLASEKDRAENTMIVDLLRNDLSKVCKDFSVKVEKLNALESFATVHHLVSTVTGVLQDGMTAIDLMAACFPGGSITGAPKVRAMEIIAELEPTLRGPYCGAIGYIGADGAMDSAIAIRTMVVREGRASFQAGGGIVADSDPFREYEETLVKARAMMVALGFAAPAHEEPALQGRKGRPR
ncbi:MAG: aminodeoxychorismate synthase component I [Parvibaculaceae bacterium]|nr:aminodeoxychorismate synthase component I [Parvibaculaceae bacterium]